MERGTNGGGRLWERGTEVRIQEALHEGGFANSLSAEDDEFGFNRRGCGRCYGCICGSGWSLETRISGKRHDGRCRGDNSLYRQKPSTQGGNCLEVDAHYRVGNFI